MSAHHDRLGRAAGAMMLGLLATACEPPPDPSPGASAVTEVGQALRLDTGVRSSQTYGTGVPPDIGSCTFLFFGCVVQQVSVQPYDLPAQGRLRQVRVWSGDYIDGYELTWQSETFPFFITSSQHIGGYGGHANDPIALDWDEAITEVTVRSGLWLDAIGFKTNKGRQWQYGGGGGSPATIPLGGRQVHGFYGSSSVYVQTLGTWSYSP
jgi:hypothetical protein